MTVLYHTLIELYGYLKTIKGNWSYFESNHFMEYIILINFRYIIVSCLLTESLTMFVGNWYLNHIYISYFNLLFETLEDRRFYTM